MENCSEKIIYNKKTLQNLTTITRTFLLQGGYGGEKRLENNDISVDFEPEACCILPSRGQQWKPAAN